MIEEKIITQLKLSLEWTLRHKDISDHTKAGFQKTVNDLFQKLENINHLSEAEINELFKVILIVNNSIINAKKHLPQSHDYLLNSKVISLEKQSKTLRFSFLLSCILPASSRKDFRNDIEDIIQELKERNFRGWQIAGVVLLNMVSVLAHAIFFKLSNYYYTATKVEK